MAGNRDSWEQEKIRLFHLCIPRAQNNASCIVSAQEARLVTERSETTGERHSRQRNITQKLGGATGGRTHVGDTDPWDWASGGQGTDGAYRFTRDR